MKVALLLTGQLRTYQMCKYIVKHCIIDRYDTDVFMTIDASNKQQNEWKNHHETTTENEILDAIAWYQPVKYCVTHEPDYSAADQLEEKLRYFVSRTVTRLLFSQYAVVQKGYKLIQDHGTKYDLIIRLRFDQFISNSTDQFFVERTERPSDNIKFSPENCEFVKAVSKRYTLQLDSPEPNTVHLLGFGILHGYPIVNDQFFSHGPDLVDRFAGFYDEMPSLLDDCTRTFFPDRGSLIEHLFYKFLFRYRINMKKSVLLGEFVREL